MFAADGFARYVAGATAALALAREALDEIGSSLSDVFAVLEITPGEIREDLSAVILAGLTGAALAYVLLQAARRRRI